MSFKSDFDRAFMKRSLEIVQTYNGPYDATILLNCLLGLLIVPKERCLKAIPLDSIDDLAEWGISPSAIQDFGTTNGKDDDPHTLRGIVWHLRNAVAHFRFEPGPPTGEVKAFYFSDGSGFKARIDLAEMRAFVERLARHLHEL